MAKKIICFSLLATILFISTVDHIHSYKADKNINLLQESSLQVIEQLAAPMTAQHDLHIEIQNNRIHLEFNHLEQLNNLQPVYAFGYFEFFSKQLRFALLNHNIKNNFYSFDLVITASSNNHIYEYTSTLPNEQFIYATNSHLLKNEETIYTSTEFKKNKERLLSTLSNEKTNGYDELDIYRYGERFFRVLTTNGKYFNPETDKELIIQALQDKFGITREQYNQIYNKYFLFFAM